MSPPTQLWVNDARGRSDFVGKVAGPVTVRPSLTSGDLEWGTDLVAELSQALLGVRVVIARLFQFGGIEFHHSGGLEVQGADHLDHDLKALVERAVSAVRARWAVRWHDRLVRRGLGPERGRGIHQVGHHDLESVAA